MDLGYQSIFASTVFASWFLFSPSAVLCWGLTRLAVLLSCVPVLAPWVRLRKIPLESPSHTRLYFGSGWDYPSGFPFPGCYWFQFGLAPDCSISLSYVPSNKMKYLESYILLWVRCDGGIEGPALLDGITATVDLRGFPYFRYLE